jgi:lysophospholipase L1-like esterase
MNIINRIYKGGLLALVLTVMGLRLGAEQLKPGDYVAVVGDSITEQRIYTQYIEDYLLMCHSVRNLQVTQFGWGGESATGLVNRIETDVLPFKPTVMTTCYGMNDGGYKASDPVIRENYKKNLTSIVEKAKTGGIRLIIIGSPGVVDPATLRATLDAEVYNKTLADLGEAAKEVATEQKVLYADVHGAMKSGVDKAKEKLGKDYVIARDGVHPSPNGHLAMAYAFLKAMGCDGAIGTITVDLKGNSATATEGHKVLSATAGTVEIESTRYPFCFPPTPKGIPNAVEMTEFIPFDEDLNRYVLIVKNPGAAKLKITWGSESKSFSAEALAKGINLAAEFRNNPFVEPFVRVEAAIRDQQAYETPTVKLLLHFAPIWKQTIPEKSDAADSLFQDLLQKDARLRKASRDTIQPVKHSIRIEPAA